MTIVIGVGRGRGYAEYCGDEHDAAGDVPAFAPSETREVAFSFHESCLLAAFKDGGCRFPTRVIRTKAVQGLRDTGRAGLLCEMTAPLRPQFSPNAHEAEIAFTRVSFIVCGMNANPLTELLEDHDRGLELDFPPGTPFTDGEQYV